MCIFNECGVTVDHRFTFLSTFSVVCHQSRQLSERLTCNTPVLRFAETVSHWMPIPKYFLQSNTQFADHHDHRLWLGLHPHSLQCQGTNTSTHTTASCSNKDRLVCMHVLNHSSHWYVRNHSVNWYHDRHGKEGLTSMAWKTSICRAFQLKDSHSIIIWLTFIHWCWNWKCWCIC